MFAPNKVKKPISILVILLGAFIIGIIIPILAPAIGIGLILSGIFIYRRATDSAWRGFAIYAIIGGAIITFICIYFGVFIIGSSSYGGSILTNFTETP